MSADLKTILEATADAMILNPSAAMAQVAAGHPLDRRRCLELAEGSGGGE